MIETASAEAPKRRGRPPKPRVEPISEPETPLQDAPENDADATIDDQSREGIPPYPMMPRFSTIQRVLSVWNGLTDRQREFGNLYLYREFPKMLLVLQRGRLVNENCDKFAGLDGPITLDLIRQKRRMGRYYIRIVQRVEKPYGQLSQSEPFTIDGNLENIEDMPILDLEKLDRAHPDNESYLRILKLRGIIKVDGDEKEGTDEMVASEVLGNITNKAIDMLGQPQQQPAPQVQSTNDGVGKELVGLLREQIQQNRPPEQQGTVGDHVKSLVDLAKSMTPPPMDLGPYVELQRENNKLVQDMMKKDVERAEAAASRAMQEAEAYKAAMPKPKSLREELREMRELQAEYKVAISGKDADEDEKPERPTAAGFWGGLVGALPMLLDKGLEIMKQANVMMYNAKLNGTGGPPLNPVTGQPGTEPLAPGGDDDDNQEQQLPPEEQARMNHMQNVANQLTAVAQPMVEHLLRNATGADFAKFVITNYGLVGINLIRSLPKETIAAMIQQYPPVWDRITQGQKVPQFQKFLDEFFGYTPVSV
jgi:hypothetical protein